MKRDNSLLLSVKTCFDRNPAETLTQVAWSSHRVHRQLHCVVRCAVRCDRKEGSEPWSRGSVRVLRSAGEPQNLTPANCLVIIDICRKALKCLHLFVSMKRSAAQKIKNKQKIKRPTPPSGQN